MELSDNLQDPVTAAAVLLSNQQDPGFASVMAFVIDTHLIVMAERVRSEQDDVQAEAKWFDTEWLPRFLSALPIEQKIRDDVSTFFHRWVEQALTEVPSGIGQA